MYHLFLFSSADKTAMSVKRLCTDAKLENGCLLKRNDSIEEDCSTTASEIAQPKLSAWLSLEKASSTIEGNWKAYLTEHILERHYSNDATLAPQYVGDRTWFFVNMF